MKTFMRLLIVVLAVSSIADGAFAQRKGRKLPEKAYIESAQIAIVSGDTVRYKEAIAMLDSLFMNYGPHPEGYFWMNQVAVDFVEKTAGLKNKEPWVKRMAAYKDSIHIACADPNVKDKYKKECAKFIERADSSSVKYWRIFFNAGQQQYEAVDEAVKELKPDADSAAKAFYQSKLNANADSAIANMQMAIVIDSTDGRAYLLAGTVLEKQGNYPASNEWLDRGLRFTHDSAAILLQIAYNNIQENKYCEAVPYFKQYALIAPSDTGNLMNLSICYNNCKMYDSAAAVYRQILGLNPKQPDALVGLGQYFNQLGLFANDSAAAYRAKNDDANTKKWTDQRLVMFDSSKVYFKQAHESDPTNVAAAEEYAVVAFVTSDFQAAADAFAKLAELEPTKSSHWVSLGDARLNLKQFKESIVAYEKAVAIDTENRQVWERLVDLYNEVGQSAKAAEAQKKLK